MAQRAGPAAGALDKQGRKLWVRVWPVARPLAIVGLALRGRQTRKARAAMIRKLPYIDRLRALAVSRGWIVELPDPARREAVLELAALILSQHRRGVTIATSHPGDAERLAVAMEAPFSRMGRTLEPLDDAAAFPDGRTTVGQLRRIAHDRLRDRILIDEPATPLRLATRQLRGKPMTVPTQRRDPAVLLVDADRALLDDARSAIAGGAALDHIFAPAEGRRALALANKLEQGIDWTVEKQPSLSAIGRVRVSEVDDTELPVEIARRVFLVTLALTALHQLRKGHDYVIEDGALTIIDPRTGEPDPGQTWTSGVQQMVELRNGLRPTPVRRSRAQIGLGEVLDKVPLLGGVAADLDGAGRELHLLYGTPVWTSQRPRKSCRIFVRTNAALVKFLERQAKDGATIVTDRPELASGLGPVRREAAEQGLSNPTELIVLADATESRRTAITLSQRNARVQVLECLSLDDPAFSGWRWRVLRWLWPVLPWRNFRASRLLEHQRRKIGKAAARQRASQKDAATRRRRLLAFASRV
ncbi:hypothetical protein [uncultured Litoreibacter sp.]|uniref:preprotein translocase subunit SecA n=1 Tax=uncultured Litoreibacter sp. TaxID=1392394 RepID=UPI0026271CD4|nr:hypothetical protein [uncultured Litoreibacter sp.]